MRTISEAGVAQSSTPSGWSSPIVRSCWLDCKQSITNDLYLPVIYFKIRRKVDTNKFDLVVVDGRQVSRDSAVETYRRFARLRVLCFFLKTNNHIFVTRTLRPGCKVASDVSRVLCCVFCASHFTNAVLFRDIFTNAILFCDMVPAHTWDRAPGGLYMGHRYIETCLQYPRDMVSLASRCFNAQFLNEGV